MGGACRAVSLLLRGSTPDEGPVPCARREHDALVVREVAEVRPELCLAVVAVGAMMHFGLRFETLLQQQQLAKSLLLEGIPCRRIQWTVESEGRTVKREEGHRSCRTKVLVPVKIVPLS